MPARADSSAVFTRQYGRKPATRSSKVCSLPLVYPCGVEHHPAAIRIAADVDLERRRLCVRPALAGQHQFLSHVGSTCHFIPYPARELVTAIRGLAAEASSWLEEKMTPRGPHGITIVRCQQFGLRNTGDQGFHRRLAGTGRLQKIVATEQTQIAFVRILPRHDPACSACSQSVRRA